MANPNTLVFTPGDPAGIGPDLAVALADQPMTDRVVIIADLDILTDRAIQLHRNVAFDAYDADRLDSSAIEVLHLECDHPVTAGQGDPGYADYIMGTLNRAVDGCLSGEFDALVTGPVNKEIMNRSGADFMGHTEYLADRTGADCPVMLLMSENLKVALVTTHIPISQVPDQITCQRIVSIGRILHNDLEKWFGLKSPRIGICGLNPHAGEGGKLGHEEITEIVPAIEILHLENIDATGPVPADTIFASHQVDEFDVILAMYHDQGLPVIKHGAFGSIVNITLGLPIIRTSVDHGTAYGIAGKGSANTGSLQHALSLAGTLSHKQKK